MQLSFMPNDFYDNDSAFIIVPAFYNPEFDSSEGLHLSRLNQTSSTENDNEISQYFDMDSRRYHECPINMETEEASHVSGEKVAFSTQGELNPTDSMIFEQEIQKNEAKAQESFYKGHLAYLSRRRSPIFPLNRKIHKTKKTNKHNQSYYTIIDKYMPGKVKGSSKRFDQKMQSQYEKLSAKEQKDHDQTYAAIRTVNASSDEDSKKIMEAYKAKYAKNRKWALFLDTFVRQA